MSIKVRITAWITLMVLLLAAMTLVFVLVINHNAITDDPAGRLVNVVQENVKDVEFDRGKFEWDDLTMYSGGVYSQFYSTDGALLHGALPEDFDPDLAFSPNIVRTVSSGGRNYFVYDSYVDMDVTGLWVRGHGCARPRDLRRVHGLFLRLRQALRLLGARRGPQGLPCAERRCAGADARLL